MALRPLDQLPAKAADVTSLPYQSAGEMPYISSLGAKNTHYVHLAPEYALNINMEKRTEWN